MVRLKNILEEVANVFLAKFDFGAYLRHARDAINRRLPQPDSGLLWLDMFQILILATLQLSVFPSFTRGYLSIDLLTPWLVISLVRQMPWRAAILGAFTALLIETHSAVPAGLYFCAYFVIWVVILNVRDAISWNHFLPWFATATIATAAVTAFEALVVFLVNGNAQLDTTNSIFLSLRVLLSPLLPQLWLNTLLGGSHG